MVGGTSKTQHHYLCRILVSSGYLCWILVSSGYLCRALTVPVCVCDYNHVYECTKERVLADSGWLSQALIGFNGLWLALAGPGEHFCRALSGSNGLCRT
jgi:hypothetical protein